MPAFQQTLFTAACLANLIFVVTCIAGVVHFNFLYSLLCPVLHMDAALLYVKLNAAPACCHFQPFGPKITPVCILCLYSFIGFNNLETLNMKNITRL